MHGPKNPFRGGAFEIGDSTYFKEKFISYKGYGGERGQRGTFEIGGFNICPT